MSDLGKCVSLPRAPHQNRPLQRAHPIHEGARAGADDDRTIQFRSGQRHLGRYRTFWCLLWRLECYEGGLTRAVESLQTMYAPLVEIDHIYARTVNSGRLPLENGADSGLTTSWRVRSKVTRTKLATLKRTKHELRFETCRKRKRSVACR